MILAILSTIDISALPFNVLSAIVAFISAYAVLKHKLKQVEVVNIKQAIDIEKIEAAALANKDTFFKLREKDQKIIDDKFKYVEEKRELLKDAFTIQIHQMDKKITEIHTIIVTNNRKDG